MSFLIICLDLKLIISFYCVIHLFTMKKEVYSDSCYHND